MTPLLPSPKHYLYNLITMTSPDAKKLWRRAIKEHFNCQCVIAEKFMKLTNLHSIMSNLVVEVGKTLQEMLFPPVKNVTKGKVVIIGSDGVERHLDVNLSENEL